PREVDGRRLEIVHGEDGVRIGRTLWGGSLARQERDRPALPVSVHPRFGRRPARQVGVREAREIDTASGRQPGPLPEARVELHELEATVPGIAFELDLREAGVVELPQGPQRRVDRLLDPDRLADATRADAGRRLP